MEAAARARPAFAGPVYARRQPEKTALYQVLQKHQLTFELQWTDQASGRTLPTFVTEELRRYLDCGILGRGFAHLYCDTCGEHHVVAFSCRARAVCPSCLGRRMNEGALNVVDHSHRGSGHRAQHRARVRPKDGYLGQSDSAQE